MSLMTLVMITLSGRQTIRPYTVNNSPFFGLTFLCRNVGVLSIIANGLVRLRRFHFLIDFSRAPPI